MISRGAGAFAFLLFVGAACAAEMNIDECAAKPRVAEFVRLKMNFDSKHFLREAHREDLDDALFLPQRKILGKVRKTAWFFEVTETGFEILSPDEAVLHRSTDGARRWLVVLNPISGKLFGLYGFEDAATSFNQLVVDAGVQIKSEEAATGWATLYLQTVIGGDLGSVLSNATDLKRGIEDLVDAYRLSRPHSPSAASWLNQVQRAGATPVLGIQVVRDGDSFNISTDTLGASANHEPVLRRVTFKIAADGQASRQAAVQRFPADSNVVNSPKVR
jgi:hypothetical protein